MQAVTNYVKAGKYQDLFPISFFFPFLIVFKAQS